MREEIKCYWMCTEIKVLLPHSELKEMHSHSLTHLQHAGLSPEPAVEVCGR